HEPSARPPEGGFAPPGGQRDSAKGSTMNPPRGRPKEGSLPLGRALWLAFLIACAVVVAITRFTADMSAFLPASPTAAQQLLVDQLRHGPVARLLLLAIEGPQESAPQRAELSQALVARLRDAPGFASVANGAALPGS